ncbi:uncharacterized protein LOC135927834 isoform X2 [Gordionus sp. m RMFG-2023]|uniref:uncharacterized protein LOC135927834 isoform X2 n=1 Tax=Gordionus sp. m RMFG-2023 TaxID=3053472 RepID=UPI0031FDA515
MDGDLNDVKELLDIIVSNVKKLYDSLVFYKNDQNLCNSGDQNLYNSDEGTHNTSFSHSQSNYDPRHKIVQFKAKYYNNKSSYISPNQEILQEKTLFSHSILDIKKLITMFKHTSHTSSLNNLHNLNENHKNYNRFVISNLAKLLVSLNLNTRSLSSNSITFLSKNWFLIRSYGYKALQNYIETLNDVWILIEFHIDYLIARDIDLSSVTDSEKIQALKLCNKCLTIISSHQIDSPNSLMNPLLAILSIPSQKEDAPRQLSPDKTSSREQIFNINPPIGTNNSYYLMPIVIAMICEYIISSYSSSKPSHCITLMPRLIQSITFMGSHPEVTNGGDKGILLVDSIISTFCYVLNLLSYPKRCTTSEKVNNESEKICYSKCDVIGTIQEYDVDNHACFYMNIEPIVAYFTSSQLDISLQSLYKKFENVRKKDVVDIAEVSAFYEPNIHKIHNYAEYLGESKIYNLANYCKRALITLIRHWSGLIYLLSTGNHVINDSTETSNMLTLIRSLELPFPHTQRLLMQLFAEVLYIPFPKTNETIRDFNELEKWKNKMQKCFKTKENWRLCNGFVASEIMEVNPIDNSTLHKFNPALSYQCNILYTLLRLDIIKTLMGAIINRYDYELSMNEAVSVQATYLVGEILILTHIYLSPNQDDYIKYFLNDLSLLVQKSLRYTLSHTAHIENSNTTAHQIMEKSLASSALCYIDRKLSTFRNFENATSSMAPANTRSLNSNISDSENNITINPDLPKRNHLEKSQNSKANCPYTTTSVSKIFYNSIFARVIRDCIIAYLVYASNIAKMPSINVSEETIDAPKETTTVPFRKRSRQLSLKDLSLRIKKKLSVDGEVNANLLDNSKSRVRNNTGYSKLADEDRKKEMNDSFYRKLIRNTKIFAPISSPTKDTNLKGLRKIRWKRGRNLSDTGIIRPINYRLSLDTIEEDTLIWNWEALLVLLNRIDNDGGLGSILRVDRKEGLVDWRTNLLKLIEIIWEYFLPPLTPVKHTDKSEKSSHSSFISEYGISTTNREKGEKSIYGSNTVTSPANDSRTQSFFLILNLLCRFLTDENKPDTMIDITIILNRQDDNNIGKSNNRYKKGGSSKLTYKMLKYYRKLKVKTSPRGSLNSFFRHDSKAGNEADTPGCSNTEISLSQWIYQHLSTMLVGIDSVLNEACLTKIPSSSIFNLYNVGALNSQYYFLICGILLSHYFRSGSTSMDIQSESDHCIYTILDKFEKIVKLNHVPLTKLILSSIFVCFYHPDHVTSTSDATPFTAIQDKCRDIYLSVLKNTDKETKYYAVHNIRSLLKLARISCRGPDLKPNFLDFNWTIPTLFRECLISSSPKNCYKGNNKVTLNPENEDDQILYLSYLALDEILTLSQNNYTKTFLDHLHQCEEIRNSFEHDETVSISKCQYFCDHLLTRITKDINGYLVLSQANHGNIISNLMAKWEKIYVTEYPNIIETRISIRYLGYEPSLGHRSSYSSSESDNCYNFFCNQNRLYIGDEISSSIPIHFYVMAEHLPGMSFLYKQNTLSKLKNLYLSDFKPIIESNSLSSNVENLNVRIKACLWSLSHLTNSALHFLSCLDDEHYNNLNDSHSIHISDVDNPVLYEKWNQDLKDFVYFTIIELTHLFTSTKSPIPIKATCFYCLNFIRCNPHYSQFYCPSNTDKSSPEIISTNIDDDIRFYRNLMRTPFNTAAITNEKENAGNDTMEDELERKENCPVGWNGTLCFQIWLPHDLIKLSKIWCNGSLSTRSRSKDGISYLRCYNDLHAVPSIPLYLHNRHKLFDDNFSEKSKSPLSIKESKSNNSLTSVPQILMSHVEGEFASKKKDKFIYPAIFKNSKNDWGKNNDKRSSSENSQTYIHSHNLCLKCGLGLSNNHSFVYSESCTRVMRLIANKIGIFYSFKTACRDLIKLRHEVPEVFDNVCFYSDVCELLNTTRYHFKTRQFIQELFSNLDISFLFDFVISL